jgi:hypothetical protein
MGGYFSMSTSRVYAALISVYQMIMIVSNGIINLIANMLHTEGLFVVHTTYLVSEPLSPINVIAITEFMVNASNVDNGISAVPTYNDTHL